MGQHEKGSPRTALFEIHHWCQPFPHRSYPVFAVHGAASDDITLLGELIEPNVVGLCRLVLPEKGYRVSYGYNCKGAVHVYKEPSYGVMRPWLGFESAIKQHTG